jgi:hypothetical protein
VAVIRKEILEMMATKHKENPNSCGYEVKKNSRDCGCPLQRKSETVATEDWEIPKTVAAIYKVIL